jgi:hypothetical protein
MAQVTAFRLDLCARCAATLKGILAKKGESAMARAIGRVLCPACLSRIPGHRPGQRLVTAIKARPS